MKLKLKVTSSFGYPKTRSRIWWYLLPGSGEDPKRVTLPTVMGLPEFKRTLKEMLKLLMLPKGTIVQMTEIKKVAPKKEKPTQRELSLKILSTHTKKDFKDFDEWEEAVMKGKCKIQKDFQNPKNLDAFCSGILRGHFDKEDGEGWFFV